MNAAQQEQVKGQIRTWLIGLAGIALGWFAQRGWLTTEQVSSLMSTPVVLAAVTMLANAVWSWYTHTDEHLIAVVDGLAKDPTSPVKAVIMTPTLEGVKIAKELPGSTTVIAGTPEARTAAMSPPVSPSTYGESKGE